MSDITRAEFNALVQKVDEIHRMLKERQPSVVPMQPYSIPPFVVSDPVPAVTLPVITMRETAQPDPWHFPTVPSKTTGDTNGQ
jgi:hypothetical protein